MNQIQNFQQGTEYKTCSGQLILQGALSGYTRDTALPSDSASDTVEVMHYKTKKPSPNYCPPNPLSVSLLSSWKYLSRKE